MDEAFDGVPLGKLRRRCPGLSDRELLEAKDSLDQYVELAVRIYERISNDPAEYAKVRAELEEQRQQGRKAKTCPIEPLTLIASLWIIGSLLSCPRYRITIAS